MSSHEFTERKPLPGPDSTDEGLDAFAVEAAGVAESVIIYDAAGDADALIDAEVVDDEPPMPRQDYRELYRQKGRLAIRARELEQSETLPLWGMLAAAVIVVIMGVYALRVTNESVSTDDDVAAIDRSTPVTTGTGGGSGNSEALQRLAASYSSPPSPATSEPERAVPPVPESPRTVTPVPKTTREIPSPERSRPAPAPAPVRTPPSSAQTAASRAVVQESTKPAPSAPPSVAVTRPWGPPIAASIRPTPAPPITSAPPRLLEGLGGGDSKVEASAPEPAAPAPAPAPAPRAEAAATSAIAPTPAVLAPPDRAAIEQVLQRYRESYTKRDASSAAAVWPGVDTRALSRAFSTLSRQDVIFDRCDLNILGARATARCVGQIKYVQRVGDQIARTRNIEWSFALERRSERWQIAQVTAN